MEKPHFYEVLVLHRALCKELINKQKLVTYKNQFILILLSQLARTILERARGGLPMHAAEKRQ